MSLHATQLAPFTVYYRQGEEFHRLKREIFTQGQYYLELATPQPVIIDAGAHIGLATLYFKKMYPKAQIWALEPLPANFELLHKNVTENQLAGVTLIAAALTGSGQTTWLHADATPTGWWSTASRQAGAWNGQQQTTPQQVPARQLSQLLAEIKQPVDILKLDIEGSELEVLGEAAPGLRQVQHLILEFHPIKTQSLTQLLALLTASRFDYQLWQDGRPITATKARGLVYVQAQKKL